MLSAPHALRSLLVAFTLLSATLTTLDLNPACAQEKPGAASSIDFVKEIKPILDRNCVECHGPKKQKGKLRLDAPDGLYRGEPDEHLVRPGDPDGSELLRRVVLPADDLDFMPEGGDPLTADEIAAMTRWIKEGATWPKSAATVIPRPKARLTIPPLSAAQQVQADAAVTRIRGQGALALAVAQEHAAHEVNYSLLGSKIGDAEAQALKGLETNLVWLNLSRTGVTDKTVQSLAEFKELRRLNLSQTETTDAALSSLASLPHLQVLNLYGTKVTDAGLIALTQLPRLKRLYLWQTAVTDAGVHALEQVLPQLTIIRGVRLLPPPEKKKENATAKLDKEATETPVKVAACCEKAKAAGKSCDHPCCIAAAKEGKVCEKCAK